MRYSSRNKRKYVILGLCLVLLLMIVGYAGFSMLLTINSSSEITDTWDVHITNVRAVNDSSLTYNDAYDKVEPTISDDLHSVTIQTGLLYPGDTRIYEIEVSNLGNIDSEVTTSFQNKINDSTIFSYDGVSPIGSDGTDILSASGSYNPSLLETEEPFFIQAFTNNKRYIYLTIKYKDNITKQPKDLNPSVTLSINATQKTHDSQSISNGVETVSAYGIEIPVVTSGDGLYDNGDGTYTYIGTNPNNYIEFNNETWRIMSIDSSGNLKIIKDERIDLSDYTYKNSNNVNGQFDPAGNRTTGYCSKGSAPTYGCNAWASTANMGISVFANGSSGDVEVDAPLNTYLNGTYKAKLQTSDDWKYVKTGMNWNVGPSGTHNDSNSISILSGMESSYKWTGDIALATKSEYLRANSDYECQTASVLYNEYQSTNYTCRQNNYLWKRAYWWWFLSPYSGFTYRIPVAATGGYVGHVQATHTDGSVRPVLYLKSSITLIGNGTNDENIYTISD